MQNRSHRFQDEIAGRCGEPHPIGEILTELLAQYQVRFPDAGIAVVKTPAAPTGLFMEDQTCSYSAAR